MNNNVEMIELLCTSCLHVTNASRYDIKTVEKLGPLLCPKCGKRGFKRLRLGTIEKLKSKVMLSKVPIHVCSKNEREIYIQIRKGEATLCHS